MAHAMTSDVVAALRGFRRQPGAIIVVVLSLSLGLGAATAMFTVVRGVLLAPLPYRDPAGLVTIWSRWTGFDKTWLSDQELVDYQTRSQTMRAVAAWDDARVTLTGAGEAIRVGGAFVTPNAFEVFGVHPVIGRTFTADEARMTASADRPTLVVLSYRLWQRQFGGDPDVAGRRLEIDGRQGSILGVMPRGFQLPTDFTSDATEPSELWLPLYIDPAHLERGSHYLFGVGRLKPGFTARQAADDLASIAAINTRRGDYTGQMRFTAFALPVTEDIFGSVRRPLLVLFGAVGLLMLIACANAAAILLARAESRQREFATRTALGASRARLVRQQLVEGGLLSAVGGLAGVTLAFAAKRVLETIGSTAIPRSGNVALDWQVVIFLVGMCTAAAVLASLPPAFRAFRVGLVDGLKDGGTQVSASGHRLRMRNTLVILQISLALLLLAGTGLTLRTLWALQKIDLGFDPSHVMTARIALPETRYDSPERVNAFFAALLTQVRALPDVKAAGLPRSLPIGSVIGDWGLHVDGYTPPPGEYTPGDWQVATEGALEALGEHLVRGRLFTAADTLESAPVALVNETMAAKYWPGREALGGRFKMGNPNGPSITVVGIVGDVRHNGVTAPIKTKFYRPYQQFSQSMGSPMRSGAVVVRTQGDPAAIAASLRGVTRALDPAVPLAAMAPMTDVVMSSLAAPRLTSTVFLTFGGVALVLAAVGIYGLLVYLVSQRAHEIGIRVAVGAGRREIVALVLRHGLRLAGLGISAGLVLSLLFSRALAGLLYGVPAGDPLTFAVVPVLLLTVALAASVVPARRAAAVDPVVALRQL